ncbi:MAG TPA: ADP-glyceromanno-heptose 6-epimerase [bacterium]
MDKPLYLVTGAAGFVGARFVESCAQRGIEVISVDKESYFRDRKEHAGVKFGEIVDRDELFDWLATGHRVADLEAIVHLGACSRTTEMDREFLLRNNVRYSQHLWQFARAAEIPMIYASSAATYGGGEQGYDDDEATMSRLRPLNPYGESKWLFDQWALMEDGAGRRPAGWAGLKFFNVYGFGERHKVGMSSVVVQGFDQIGKEGEIRLFESHKPGVANGHQQRDFIWVQDVVNVLHFCVERALNDPTTRGIYNLGTGHARTFLDLAKAVFAALGKPENIRFVPMPEALRERYQYFTEAKMERLRTLGYEAPFTSLEDGVAAYVKRLAQVTPVKAPKPRR